MRASLLSKLRSRSGSIILLWLVWAILLIGFQQFLTARLPKAFKTAVLAEAALLENDQVFYLTDPFLNEQVAWDSKFYLSIAIAGFDDPQVGMVAGGDLPGGVSLNYSRFPLYPILVRSLAWPLEIFGLRPVAAATLAGVLISLLGTLAAMFALFDLAVDHLGDEGAFRAVFYLLVFPTGFYLAQVYTEGLFIGCAFTSLALMRRARRRKRFLLASALLAALATWTRPVGVALAPALLVSILASYRLDEPAGPGSARLLRRLPWKDLGQNSLFVLLPIGAYLSWALSPLGERFRFIMDTFFGAKTLSFLPTIVQWVFIVQLMLGNAAFQTSDSAYTISFYLFELFTLLLGLVAAILIFKQNPETAVYCLVVWVISTFTALPYGYARYALVLPATFVLLGQLGKDRIFDRGWTTFSVLLMGLFTTLYSLNLLVD